MIVFFLEIFVPSWWHLLAFRGHSFAVFSWGWHSLCFQDHFALWNTLLQNGLVHFASQFTLLHSTLYSLKHFTPQHTLLPRIIFSSAHFASWNTFLPRILCFLCSSLLRQYNLGTPTPWLMRIHFPQISLTRLFKTFPLLTLHILWNRNSFTHACFFIFLWTDST